MLKRKHKAPPATLTPDPTDVRFGMRGLLLTTLVVAVASTILRPLFRDLPPDRRGQVMATWCTAAAIVLVLVGYHSWHRIGLERLGGRRLFTLPARVKLGFVPGPWLVAAEGLLWIAFGLYYLAMIAVIVRGPRTVPVPAAQHVIPCLVSGALISMGIVTIWWGRGAQLREAGILRGLKLLRWTHTTAHRWKGGDLYLEGVDQRHRDTRVTVVVGDNERAAITHLIAQKLNRQPEASADIALGDEEYSEKKPPLVRIGSQTDVTIRGMVTAFTVYALAAIFIAARPWGTPPLEFVVGVGVGSLGFVVAWIIAAMRAGKAGAPRIRLAARWDWPSILRSLAAAVGGYFLVQRFVFPPRFVAVGLGTISGFGAATLVELMLCERFDLCENGIMLVRWRFLPWANTKVLKWAPAANGVLLLRSGWRRLAANVSADQRDAVARMLVEKLGSNVALVASEATPDALSPNSSSVN